MNLNRLRRTGFHGFDEINKLQKGRNLTYIPTLFSSYARARRALTLMRKTYGVALRGSFATLAYSHYDDRQHNYFGLYVNLNGSGIAAAKFERALEQLHLHVNRGA